MGYERINWEDTPSTKTPINAENLNKMDQGIKDAHEGIEKIPEWLGENFYVKETDTHAIQTGVNTEASGEASRAHGTNAKAFGKGSVAFGNDVAAQTEGSIAFGTNNVSGAMGYYIDRIVPDTTDPTVSVIVLSTVQPTTRPPIDYRNEANSSIEVDVLGMVESVPAAEVGADVYITVPWTHYTFSGKIDESNGTSISSIKVKDLNTMKL